MNKNKIEKMMKSAERITVSSEVFDKIVDLCNQPPKPSSELQKLMSKPRRYKREF